MKWRRTTKIIFIMIGILFCVAGVLMIFFSVPGSKTKTEFDVTLTNLIAEADHQEDVFQERDFSVLPEPVKRYFRCCGYIGTQKMSYIKIDYTVPALSIVFMAVSALIGIAIPVVLFLFFRKKYKADILPFFIGCAIFIVFALLFESFVHKLIFATGTGKAILNNIWLYGIYAGMMAGLFEETGRYTTFKTVLRRKRVRYAKHRHG